MLTQLGESIKMAVAALVSNKLRAALTTLGVVVGITFVLLMGWLLTGLDNALEQTLAIMGDDILYVDKFEWGSANWQQERNRKDITYHQYLEAARRLKTPTYVVPTASQRAETVRYGDLQLESIQMFGTTSDYIDMLGGNIGQGRFFSQPEAQAGAKVAVIGYNIVDQLFGQQDPIGATIRINGRRFQVIGAMPKRGSLMTDFVDNQVIIPLKTFFGMFGNRSRITINVKAGGVDRIEDVRYETIGVMRQIRSLGPGQENDFAVNTQQQFREQFDQLRIVVWSVGLVMTGLSFLVGSIGIMNIMFVSVTERTKEIGIRKAIGATRSSILVQFLVEAIMLCLMGALIGFAITSLVAWLGATQFDISFLSPTIPVSQIVIAVIVSVAVGVLAGIVPAFRAARMDPVDALRAE